MKQNNQLFHIFVAIALVLALPLTLFVGKKVNEYRSRAAGENARLSMPATINVSGLQEFEVPITLNTGGTAIRGVDIVLQFDRTKLRVTSISKDAAATTSLNAFVPVSSDDTMDDAIVMDTANATGKIAFGAATFNPTGQAVTAAFNGTTLLSKITFQPLTAGTSTIRFEMHGGLTTDSNIVSDTNPPVDYLAQTSQVTNTIVTVAGDPQPTNVVPTQPQPTTPQPTTPPGSTNLSLEVFLHGIGKGGDNVNANSGGNNNPLHPERIFTVALTNVTNTLPASRGALRFDSVSGSFKGTINLGASFTSGPYQVRINSDRYLWRVYQGVHTITNGQTKQLPAIYLVAGDVNQDTKLSILDYNVILDCFSDISQPRNCSDGTKKAQADITDDGNVNQFDYNLLIRELSVQGGDF